jgi:hypothetical protein
MTDPTAVPASPADADPAPTPSFAGRTPSKTSAIRAGIAIGTALVVVIGTAVAMGASSRPSTSGAGPAAAASGSPAPDKGPRGNGFGHGGFGPSFGFGVGPLGGLPKALGDGAGRGFGRVTITAIDGSKVSLTTEDGWTRTITLTSTTTVTRGGAAATAADLHVGDAIRFRQERGSDGSFTISAVDIVLPHVLGTITKVDGSTLTLTARDGSTVTAHLGGSTQIRVRGVANATAKDLAAGQVVIVAGEKRSDGSIDATSVLSGQLRVPKLEKPKRDGGDESEAPDASGQGG